MSEIRLVYSIVLLICMMLACLMLSTGKEGLAEDTSERDENLKDRLLTYLILPKLMVSLEQFNSLIEDSLEVRELIIKDEDVMLARLSFEAVDSEGDLIPYEALYEISSRGTFEPFDSESNREAVDYLVNNEE